MPSKKMHVSVIGTGSPGEPKSILISTESTRYLVNCGESTTRILTEHKSKASRIHHVFFTKLTWDYFSGLLGLALTARAAGVKKILLHGPSQATELIKLTRHFADTGTTDVGQSDILTKPFVDNNFYISAFEFDPYNINLDEEIAPKRHCPEEAIELSSMYAYLFKPLPSPRKLQPEKCLQLGMPRRMLESPAARRLVEGKIVELEDGTKINPLEVTLPAANPQNFLVVDCPSAKYIPMLCNDRGLFTAISSTQSATHPEIGTFTLSSGISLVIHFLPEGLFYTEEYQQFVHLLDKHGQMSPPDGLEDGGASLRHLILDGTGKRPPMLGIYGQSTILNHYFDQLVYPKLYNQQMLQAKEPAALKDPKPFDRFVHGESLLQYQLRPHQGFSSTACLSVNEKDILENAFDPYYIDKEEARAFFLEMQERLSAAQLLPVTESASDMRGRSERWQNEEWPELLFLGTASSTPNKYRNMSAILLRLSADECILMDCAEGTLNQLYSMFGEEKTHQILCGLKAILLTHMHADHHGGIFTIALKRSEVLSRTGLYPVPPLALLSPPPFLKWTQRFSEIFQAPQLTVFSIADAYQPVLDETESMAFTGLQETTVSDASTVYISPETLRATSVAWILNENRGPLVDEWKHLLGTLSINVHPVKVPHTGTSWAFVIESLSEITPWKLVYSGDTPPYSKLASAGRGCDLLIHEATMDDDYADLAVASHHSTTSGALEIGRLMQAKFILLNHFSQRHSRLPGFDSFQNNLAPTFDFMQVKLRDLWRLPFYLPYYKYAFAKDWSLQQTRSENKQQRKIRDAETLRRNKTAVQSALTHTA